MAPTIGQSAPPRSLIVSVYGLYAPRAAATDPAWLSVAALVRLLADVGVDEPAVRSAISRLKRRGALVAQRSGGQAGYALSNTARAIMAEGDQIIFTPPVPDPTDGWLLAVFSVPESQRARRHTLRSQLASLGFGTAAPGVWVAPAHRFDLTHAVLRRHELQPYVDLFRADYLAYGDVAVMVKQWWDLDALAGEYHAFVDRWKSLARKGNQPADASTFAAWTRVVTDWRRLPYQDPGLPPELLPTGWPGTTAATVLAKVRETHAIPAAHYVDSTAG
jgi:phenylacetic acid degradation operon negative regulatory protein